MQDIAGSRIVADMTRLERDVLASEIRDTLASTIGPIPVIDRRRKPSHGYRAVHIVVTRDGRLIELQVRTRLQNQWAQIVERLGDSWGRQIRYGGAPDPHPRGEEMTELKRHIVEEIVGVSAQIDDLERAVVDAKIKFYQAPGTQHVDLNGSDDDVPADLQALRSNYRQAVEMRRRATEVIRTAFARMADLAEREG